MRPSARGSRARKISPVLAADVVRLSLTSLCTLMPLPPRPSYAIEGESVAANARERLTQVYGSYGAIPCLDVAVNLTIIAAVSLSARKFPGRERVVRSLPTRRLDSRNWYV